MSLMMRQLTTTLQQQQQQQQLAVGRVSSDMDDEQNMSSELRYEAPLATFDGDEWNEFLDVQNTMKSALTDAEGNIQELNTGSVQTTDNNTVQLNNAKLQAAVNGSETVDNFCETFSGSLEDLVNTFDAKVTKCFRNYNEQAEQIAPVQIRTQEELIADSQTWWTITGQVGSDWYKTYTIPTATLYDNQYLHPVPVCLKRSNSADTSSTTTTSDSDVDDDDSEAEYDVATLPYDVTTPEEEEPLLTADEVISEIECMMEDTSPLTSQRPLIGYKSMTSPVRPELLRFSDVANGNSTNCQNGFPLHDDHGGLDCLSVGALSELTDELQRCVHEYSEELVSELARRDELDFEKELKNHFIWLLLRVQKRCREVQLDGARPTITKNNKTTAPAAGYLNTVIPYEPSHGPPSADRLQIYIKILSAINEDSNTLPTLLTDYILNVLCPTSM